MTYLFGEGHLVRPAVQMGAELLINLVNLRGDPISAEAAVTNYSLDHGRIGFVLDKAFPQHNSFQWAAWDLLPPSGERGFDPLVHGVYVPETKNGGRKCPCD